MTDPTRLFYSELDPARAERVVADVLAAYGSTLTLAPGPAGGCVARFVVPGRIVIATVGDEAPGRARAARPEPARPPVTARQEAPPPQQAAPQDRARETPAPAGR